MKITKEIWGRTPEGNDIHRYTLENSKGCFVRLCDVGAAIVSIGVPDRDGKVADVVLGYTPVKNQDSSQLCWAYAMLATMESEHIMKGDSVNLSVAYIARMMLQEKAVNSKLRLTII